MIENDIILQNHSLAISQSSDVICDENDPRDIVFKENCEERVNEEALNDQNIQFEGYIYNYDVKPIALRNLCIYLFFIRIFFNLMLFLLIYQNFSKDYRVYFFIIFEPLGLFSVWKINFCFNLLYALLILLHTSMCVYYFAVFSIWRYFQFILSLMFCLAFTTFHIIAVIKLSIVAIKLSRARKQEIEDTIRRKKIHFLICLT